MIWYDTGKKGVGVMNSPRPKQENRFSVVLPPELREQIKEAAARTQRTEGAMIRRLITKGLESYREGIWSGE